MRLSRVVLRRFQQFIDETLEIDPRVTVIVGKNDTGKTSLLRQFFDQHVYESVIHGRSRPQVPGFVGDPIEFSLQWEVAADDYEHFPLDEAFGRRDVHSIEVRFQQHDHPNQDFTYLVNGELVTAYEGRGAGGWPVMREVLSPRGLFPRPHYISVGEASMMPSVFEARLYELPDGAMEMLRIEDQLFTEALFLRIAGIRAETRHVGGRGVDEPWPSSLMSRSRSGLTVAEIEERLAGLARRITEKLREWWQDPAGLNFSISIGGEARAKEYQHRLNSYAFTWGISDPSGHTLYSTGLMWFLAFLVKLVHLEDQPKPCLLLFDEPATPLHPSAQRMVARLLDSLSARHQVVYTTHSPFLIDWNFPQRVRLFERDDAAKRTRINNKPYRKAGRFDLIWDPLRESIGVTLGDVSIVGEVSVLAEGFSDQVLLANVSAFLESQGCSHFDLRNVSIVPYSDELALRYIVSKARALGGRVVVLIDADEQGRRIGRFCEREGYPVVGLSAFTDRPSSDSAIEDLIGIDEYTGYVNRFYGAFEWFSPLDTGEVRDLIGDRSLGRCMTGLFQERFGQNFSKTSVSILIADELRALPPSVIGRFQALIEELLRAAGYRGEK